eukprot:scaffold11728_cov32-Tisochrysis_lutea.AAC.2
MEPNHMSQIISFCELEVQWLAHHGNIIAIQKNLVQFCNTLALRRDFTTIVNDQENEKREGGDSTALQGQTAELSTRLLLEDTRCRASHER